MIPNKAIKIFIEPDEEIVFIVEKILSANSGRVILIIPNTAILISSAVSLKILAMQIMRSDKLIVLVSDTSLAKSLGNQAKLIVCDKVSEVTKDAWQRALEQKNMLSDEVNRIKQELLSARQEPLGDPLRVEDLIKKVLPKKNDSKDKAVGMPVTPEKVKAVIIDEPEKKPESLIIKPRLKERVMDINGIKLVAGGDILNNQELVDMERGRLNQVLELNLKKEDNYQTDNFEKKEMYKDSGLVGVDMTSQLSASPYAANNQLNINKKPKTAPAFIKKTGEFFQTFFQQVSFGKFMLGIGIALIAFFGVSYFFFASAKVEIEQTATKFSIKKTVTAKVDVDSAYDLGTLTISAQSITKDQTLSSEGTATGQGSTGEYAQGQLLIYNPTTSAVSIKEGQIFTNDYTSETLKYKALQSVTVPTASTATVNVKATSFGEKYNVATTMKTFLIEGITGLSAQNVTVLTGGTTVATVVVSQEDIDALKATMTESLKNQLLTAMKSTLGDDDILFTGTEKFNEVSFATSVAVNTAAQTFSADLKMTISAVMISKTELKKLLVDVGKSENGYSNVDLSDPVTENIVQADKVVTFDTRANAVGTNDLDVEDITSKIKGMGVNEAKDLIKSYAGVSNVYIQYTPPYIPQFIQKIPSDDSKLTVTVKMAKTD